MLLKDALKQHNFSEDAEILARAATIVGKTFLHTKDLFFLGAFQWTAIQNINRQA